MTATETTTVRIKATDLVTVLGDVRPGCTAKRHDTSSAYKRHGCRCPKARAAEVARKAKYDRNRTGRRKLEASSMIDLSKPGAPDFRTDPRRGCAAGKVDPDVMFADDRAGIQAAKNVCAPCPFTAECHAWAVEHAQVFGVWGGISAPERRKEIHRLHRQSKADAA